MARCFRGLPLGVGFLLFVACGGDSGDGSPGGDESGGAGGSAGASMTGSGGKAGGTSSGSGGNSGGSSSGAAGSSGGDGGSGGSGPGVEQCVEITTFETGKDPEKVLHVAVEGSAEPDGSEEKPFGSLLTAMTVATPGTAIRLHAGKYPGDLSFAELNGTEDAPIWIGGAPGEERPVIGGDDFDVAMHLRGGRYLVLHDLVIEDTLANGINADDDGRYDDPEALHHVVFRNLSIRNIGTGGNNDCLKLSGANQFWVLDSEFSNCSSGGSGIDMVGCHDGLIARNRFVGGGNAVQTKGGSQNVEIRSNLFVENDGRAANLGGSTDYEYFRPQLTTNGGNAEAREIRFVANVLDRPTEAIAFVGCVDCLVANNTVYRPGLRVLRILQETVSDGPYTFLPTLNGRVVNNLFFFTRAEVTSHGRAINIGGDTSPETFTYTNNLWFASDDVESSEPNSAYGGATVTGTLEPADPSFSGASAGDFAIESNSPAAAAGVELEEVPADYRGACYATPRAVGALEVLE